LSLANATRAAGSLDEWRVKAAETRTLAENDTPRAYEQAQRLQATLPADAPSTDHARALNLLARAETYLGMTEQAAGHAHQALDLARRNGDAAGQAEADLTLALTSVNLAKLDELVAVTTHSITVLDGVDRPDLLGESLLRAGMMYRRVGLIDEAVRVSVQAMEIARRSKAPLVLAYAHQGMAIAFVQSDRAREAHDHFVQMQAQARAAHSRLIEGDALAGLAGVENTLGDPQAAESHYRDAIAVFREVGAPLSANFGIVSLAQMLRDQHRTAEAAALFDAAIATYERLSTWIGLWYALNGRSSNFQLQGNIAAAFADAERAYDLARKIDFPLYLSESARRMAELSAVKGDHRRAYELAVLAAEMTAKAAREKTSARMVELVRRYEDESRRREIQELTRRNQEQAAALQRHALEQRWLWTVLVGSVALFAGAAFVLIRLRSLNAGLEQRVQARTSELRQQTRYLRALIDTLPLSV
jgi:tetratricopeptide (TPR) repeat protein